MNKQQLTLGILSLSQISLQTLNLVGVNSVFSLLMYGRNELPNSVDEKRWQAIRNKIIGLSTRAVATIHTSELRKIVLYKEIASEPSLTLGYAFFFEGAKEELKDYLFENNLTNFGALCDRVLGKPEAELNSVEKKAFRIIKLVGIAPDTYSLKHTPGATYVNDDGKLCLTKLGYDQVAIAALAVEGIYDAEDLFKLVSCEDIVDKDIAAYISAHTLLIRDDVLKAIPLEVLYRVVLIDKERRWSDKTLGHDFIFGMQSRVWIFCEEFKDKSTFGDLCGLSKDALVAVANKKTRNKLGQGTVDELIGRQVCLGVLGELAGKAVEKRRAGFRNPKKIDKTQKHIGFILDKISEQARSALWLASILKMEEILSLEESVLATKYKFNPNDLDLLKTFKEENA